MKEGESDFELEFESDFVEYELLGRKGNDKEFWLLKERKTLREKREKGNLERINDVVLDTALLYKKGFFIDVMLFSSTNKSVIINDKSMNK